MNHAKERIQNDSLPTFPGDDIICRKCTFKRPGIIGYKNSYCEQYDEGKPDGILFEGEPCRFFEVEK